MHTSIYIGLVETLYNSVVLWLPREIHLRHTESSEFRWSLSGNFFLFFFSSQLHDSPRYREQKGPNFCDEHASSFYRSRIPRENLQEILEFREEALGTEQGQKRGEAASVISEARSVWQGAKRYRGLDRANNDSTIPNGVYISVFGGLRRRATRPRQREREQERGKKGNKDLFSLTYQSGARLVSQKSIFAR